MYIVEGVVVVNGKEFKYRGSHHSEILAKWSVKDMNARGDKVSYKGFIND